MKHVLLLALLMATSACSTVKRPFLYHAERGDEKLTLLGTIHIGVPKSDLPSAVLDELRTSDKAFFEIEVTADDLTGDSAQSKNDKAEWRKGLARRLMRADTEPTLEQRLPPDYFRRLKARLPLAKYPGLPTYLNPSGAIAFLLNGQVATVTRYEANMLNPFYMMDFELEEEARDRKIPVLSLDRSRVPCQYETGSGSISDLMAVLDGKDTRSFLDDSFALVEAYRTGEDTAVQSFLSNNNDGMNKCILGKRNREWAEALDRVAEHGKKFFVAVGCAHLLTQSDASLLELLRKKGFQISRVEEN